MNELCQYFCSFPPFSISFVSFLCWPRIQYSHYVYPDWLVRSHCHFSWPKSICQVCSLLELLLLHNSIVHSTARTVDKEHKGLESTSLKVGTCTSLDFLYCSTQERMEWQRMMRKEGMMRKTSIKLQLPRFSEVRNVTCGIIDCIHKVEALSFS